MKPQYKLSGFTLVELLVVIAILSILTGILFPIFSKAKREAKKISGVSNAGQLTKSIIMYANDFDDMFPPYCTRCICSSCPESIIDGPGIWYATILPYTGNGGVKPTGQGGVYLVQDLPDIYFDPSEVRIPIDPLNDICQPFGAYASWGINDFLVNKVGTLAQPGDGKPISFTAVSDTSKVAMLVQTTDYACNGRVAGVALAVPPYEFGHDGHNALETVDGFYGAGSEPITFNTPRSQWGRNIVAKVDGSVKVIHRSDLVDHMENWKP